MLNCGLRYFHGPPFFAKKSTDFCKVVLCKNRCPQNAKIGAFCNREITSPVILYQICGYSNCLQSIFYSDQLLYQHTMKLFMQSRDLMTFTLQNSERLIATLDCIPLSTCSLALISKTLQNAMPSPNCNLA